MSVFRFLSHPQVRVSADIPVPRWGLTDLGRQRVESASNGAWLSSVVRLLSSDETKALETAAVLATSSGLGIEVRPGLRENDRSSTGFVPEVDFEHLADAFFSVPDESVEGWETSRNAQARIVEATADLLGTNNGDVVVSGHGGVGTLLLCHLLGKPISRDHDQCRPPAASGGGNHWAFDLQAGSVVHGWRPIEELAVGG